MNFSRRMLFLRACFLGSIFILIMALFQIQIVQTGYFRRVGESNRLRLIRIPAPRGEIMDSRGAIVATNRVAYDVNIIPEDFNPKNTKDLTRLLDLSAADIRGRVMVPRHKALTPVTLKKDVPRDIAMQIEERRPLLSGVYIETNGVRSYPFNKVGSHVLGYIGKITKQEYESLDPAVFSFQSEIGRRGIERVFDSTLRGEDGGRQIEVNARGEQIKLLSEKNPTPGQPLQISLDFELQKEIYGLIGRRNVAVAMMNVKNGELLALQSSPSYDPNIFVSGGKDILRVQALKDPSRPMMDRTTTGIYPPGSVFKLVTALAGLETGKITRYTTFTCNGIYRLSPRSRPFRCWDHSGHGQVSLLKAIERSCNVYFYNVGNLVGESKLSDYARSLGLGEPVSLEIPTSDGFIPSAEWKENKFHDHWYAGETISFAIGQGYVQTTPLQVLRLVSIFATNGKLIEPTLLKNKARNAESAFKALHFKSESIKAVKQGMLQVTESRYGTGQLARVDFMKIAGKTGTAQAPPHEAHAWFAGFFPYENPEVALVVVVEHGGSGGLAAAQLAKKIVSAWRRIYEPNTIFEKPSLPPVQWSGA